MNQLMEDDWCVKYLERRNWEGLEGKGDKNKKVSLILSSQW